jgi:hypothetical protein
MAAILLLAGAAPALAHAQSARDSVAFVQLRGDGNGITALRTTIRSGFDGPASKAVSAIAVLAALNLTFDPSQASLARIVSIAAHERTAAVALLEVAVATRLRVRVSREGQIVVDAIPGDLPTTSIARDSAGQTSARSGPGLTTLQAIQVTATMAERALFLSSASSAYTASRSALRAMPVFVEPDVMRSVQTLPGIVARSDWSAGFSVRGGEGDQSLVLLDGHPIYNPFHLGGVFSTFIEPLVGGVELRTGALPARYGGRVSGVLDVASASPPSDEISGTAALSLMSTALSAGRTFANGDGEWIVGARRTYADRVVDLFKADAFPYHFQDAQARVVRRLPHGLRLAVTAYAGADEGGGKSSTAPTGGWGNELLGLTVSKTIGDSMIAEQKFTMSRFHANLAYSPSRAANRVQDLRMAGTLTAHRPTFATTIGYELGAQSLSYYTSQVFVDWGDLIPTDSLDQSARSAALFVEHEWRPTSRLLLNAGARMEAVQHTSGLGVSPRASLKYFLNPNTALSAGGGRYTQWVHSLGRAEEPLQPLQFWVLSDSLRHATVVKDMVVGVERWLSPSRLLHVGTYYKQLSHVLVPNEYSDPTRAGDSFRSTNGVSYGVDVLLRQLEGGSFSGWISYAYALSARTERSGFRYAPPQDRRHNVNVVGGWRLDRYTLGLHVSYGSGLPTTPVVGAYSRSRYDAATRRWVSDASSAQLIRGVLGSDRLPAYRRIDLSATRNGWLFGRPFNTYVSVLNVLNADNPAGYLYSFDSRSTRIGFPNLPFVPTVGVTIGY